MFHAGVVAPSSVFLLQLLTFPTGEADVSPFVELISDLVGLDRPPYCWLGWLEVTELTVLLALLIPRFLEKPDVLDGRPPVV